MKPSVVSRILLSTIMTLSLGMTAPVQAATRGNIPYTFTRNGDGGRFPIGNLVADAEGNLYGATQSAATDNGGTIFQLVPNNHGGWMFNPIVQCGANACTASLGSLVMDSSGNLYGTTIFGSIFEVSPDGSGGWTLKQIYLFSAGANGDESGPLAIDAAGNLYGTVIFGGANGLGYIYELSQQTGSWALTDLHDFSGPDGDNSDNAIAVTLDSAGNIFGTTSQGGTSTNCPGGCGVVFELVNNDGTWTETVLHDFQGVDGASPAAPLLLDGASKIYGTAANGGNHQFGVVFEMNQVAGNWTSHVIYRFTGGPADGAVPASSLFLDKFGNLYGTTVSGGVSNECTVGLSSGCGTAFELSPSGKTWGITILHNFTDLGDGGFPQGLLPVSGNRLVGLAEAGGAHFAGTVFQLFLNQ